MRILVLGGDGYCGWPTSLYLSHQGHDVAIADSFHRLGLIPKPVTVRDIVWSPPS